LENTLIDALPRILHITAVDHEISRWLEPTLRLLSFEARDPKQGSASIISRLTAIVFVQAIRIWVETNTENKSGWLAALRDAQISRALNLLHHNPAEKWTVAKIAAAVGMSRSPFAAKFSALVGEPPLAYLKKWRMNLAAGYLQTDSLDVAQVAPKVGYESEAAFSKSFKQHFGKPPRSFKENNRIQEQK
jgi:transcriptional regulator GlxA family with amidase domain